MFIREVSLLIRGGITMKTIILTVLTLLLSFTSTIMAQNVITYTYDEAGNRVTRTSTTEEPDVNQTQDQEQ